MKDERKKKKIENAFYLIVLGPMFVGGNLFFYFIDKIPGQFESSSVSDYVLLNATMVGSLLITFYFMKWREKRRGNIPAVDERTLKIMKNYFLWVLYFVFIISGAILIVLFLQGIETIEIGMIFVYLSALIILIILGAAIAIRA